MEEQLYPIDPVSSEENDRLAMDLSCWLGEGRQRLEERLRKQVGS